MSINAGILRHRIRIEMPFHMQDPETGANSVVWGIVPGCASVPAAIQPLSAREFMAAQSRQAEMISRIVIRYRSGLDATMRAVHRGKYYEFAGPPLPDVDSGLEYLTIPVSEGVLPVGESQVSFVMIAGAPITVGGEFVTVSN